MSLEKYSNDRLLKFTSEFMDMTDKTVFKTQAYAIASIKQFNTVLPRFTGIVYDPENDVYQEFVYEQLHMQNDTSIEGCFKFLRGVKYSFGKPVILTTFVFPITIQDTNLMIAKDMICIFLESELRSKHALYDYIDGKLEFNVEMTRSCKLPKNLLKLAFLNSPVPEMN